jgi:hypothetical protein
MVGCSGLQPLYDNPSLWVGSLVACGKVAISGLRNYLNYCELSTVYITQFTNVGPRVGDPLFKGIQR